MTGEEIDLGRLSSTVLTEIRTVLSRAQTALGTIERNPNLWFQSPKPLFSKENNQYIGRTEGEKVKHPDVEEMISVLQTTVEKLKKWEKTGRTNHREGELGVPPRVG